VRLKKALLRRTNYTDEELEGIGVSVIFNVGLREDCDERGFAYLGKANYSSFHVFMSLLEEWRGSESED